MKNMKKFLGVIISMMLLIGVLPAMPVHASGTVIVAVSSSSLNIGDTVTVTATPQGPGGEQTTAALGFSYDSGKLSFISCSESTYSGGGGGYVGVVGEKASITLKATAAGSASVSVSGSDGVIFSSNEEIGELSAGGTTLTVNNAGGGSGAASGNAGTDNPDAGTDNTNKSADNSLSSLTISPGSLSPAFKYSITSYTAAVGDDVTEIAVDAKASNANATVETVTGNTNLKPGANTISIVVKAENGTTATYKIVVTKGGQADSQEPQETPKENDEGKPDENIDENTGAITLNGHGYNLSPAIADDLIPADFSKTTITCNGTQTEALQFDKGNVVLVYLTTPDTEVKNTLAVYDQTSGSFYPFIKVPLSDNNYIIILNPPAETGLPQEYAAISAEIGTYGAVSAFGIQSGAAGTDGNAGTGEAPGAAGETDPGENSQVSANISDFYLVYAVSSQGNTGWYQYDKKEATFQRYVQNEISKTEENQEDTIDTDMKSIQSAYDKLDEQYKKEKSFARKTIAILIFLAAVLIVVIVNLLLRNRKDGDDDWDNDFERAPKRFLWQRKEAEEPEVEKEQKPVEKNEKAPARKPVEKPKEKPVEKPIDRVPEKAGLNKPLEDEPDDFEVIDLDDL